ncbi:MAG: hypothetical protein RL678_985, partial [Pseudomonadota bacterium]
MAHEFAFMHQLSKMQLQRVAVATGQPDRIRHGHSAM